MANGIDPTDPSMVNAKTGGTLDPADINGPGSMSNIWFDADGHLHVGEPDQGGGGAGGSLPGNLYQNAGTASGNAAGQAATGAIGGTSAGAGAGLLGGISTADWLKIAAFLYSAYKGNQPPKITNAPLTPTEQWDAKTKEGLYNSLAPYISQYLSGIGNLQPNWSMPNDKTGNPAFMGGVQVPHMGPVNIPTNPVTP